MNMLSANSWPLFALMLCGTASFVRQMAPSTVAVSPPRSQSSTSRPDSRGMKRASAVNDEVAKNKTPRSFVCPEWQVLGERFLLDFSLATTASKREKLKPAAISIRLPGEIRPAERWIAGQRQRPCSEYPRGCLLSYRHILDPVAASIPMCGPGDDQETTTLRSVMIDFHSVDLSQETGEEDARRRLNFAGSIWLAILHPRPSHAILF